MDGAVPGDNNHQIVASGFFNEFEEFKAVNIGHAQVGDDQIVSVGRKSLHCPAAVMDGVDLITFFNEYFLEVFSVELVVFRN